MVSVLQQSCVRGYFFLLFVCWPTCCLWWLTVKYCFWAPEVLYSWPQLCPAQPWSLSPRTDMKNIYGLTCGAIFLQHKLSWLSACSLKINFDVSSSKSALIKYLLAHLIWMWINGQSVSSCPLYLSNCHDLAKDLRGTSHLSSVAFPLPLSVCLHASHQDFLPLVLLIALNMKEIHLLWLL